MGLGRVVAISSPGYRLRVRNRQLECLHEDRDLAVPLEDLALVLIDTPQVSFTGPVLREFSSYGVCLVVCDEKHLPSSLCLPVSRHLQATRLLHAQVDAPVPRRKQLWKQVVRAKIRAQASIIEDPGTRGTLSRMATKVRSGDASNEEGRAAHLYWQRWLGDAPFGRSPQSDGLNGMLDYGYAILRSAVARALVQSGLHPALGVYHRRRDNPYCLADDLVEPLRPLVDRTVRNLWRNGAERLESAEKAVLIGLVHESIGLGDSSGPLLAVLPRYTASFGRCISGEDRLLVTPTIG